MIGRHFTVRCVSFLGLCYVDIRWSTGTKLLVGGATKCHVTGFGTRARAQRVIQSQRDTYNVCRREDA